jgi:CMP-N,N'-diacetyllegionaminic acid synthase
VNTIAIIPARSGSQRVPGKNVRPLNGHPLLAYSIYAAASSGVCDRILVSTDSPDIAEIARNYGAEVPGLRPAEISGPKAHDILFLRHAMEEWVPSSTGQLWAILRPTSPLRSGASIRAAHEALLGASWADSVRALKPVTEHPGKMWRVGESGEATTYLEQGGAYNGPTQDLEPLFVQASSLEIVRRDAALSHNSIAGSRVLAHFLPEWESLDINSESDWKTLESVVAENPGLLPALKEPEL